MARWRAPWVTHWPHAWIPWRTRVATRAAWVISWKASRATHGSMERTTHWRHGVVTWRPRKWTWVSWYSGWNHNRLRRRYSNHRTCSGLASSGGSTGSISLRSAILLAALATLGAGTWFVLLDTSLLPALLFLVSSTLIFEVTITLWFAAWFLHGIVLLVHEVVSPFSAPLSPRHVAVAVLTDDDSWFTCQRGIGRVNGVSEMLREHVVLKVLIPSFVPPPSWIAVHLSLFPPRHSFPRHPHVVVMLHSNTSLPIHIRQPHLPFLIQLSVEALSALRKLLVLNSADELFVLLHRLLL